VRLLQPVALVNNIPIAYQAAKVMKRDAKGRTRVSLAQLRPKDRGAAADIWQGEAMQETA
jgi:hypothetical protein